MGSAGGRSSAPAARLTASTAPIAINGRAAVRREIGGVERVARELTARLTALRPDRYSVLRPPAALAFRAGHLWEQAALGMAARRHLLLFSPANLAPLAAGRRNVVMIHDVAALRRPEAYGRLYVAYQRRMLPALARRARRVLTVSEFSRAELAELLCVPPAAIEVVPNGVDERFSPEADASRATGRLGIDGPYVLAVGTRSERKNLGALVEAALRLGEMGVELVVAGSGRGYLRGEAPPAPIRLLGYVEDDLLPGLYAGARALAMPSLHEGFGLPCLEAMACGVPVVAARRGALPETCGDAALLVDPDPGELADALAAVLTDEELRNRLRQSGLERARRFGWDAAAARADAVLEAALEEARGEAQGQRP
jgi:glycosyltransferase involved in cell wall biosynthesis